MVRSYLLIISMLGCIFNDVVTELKEEEGEEDFSADNQVNSLRQAPFVGCSNDSYPPTFWQHIPEYVIDLDKPPEERWVELITNKKTDLLQMFAMMKNNTSQMFGDKIFKLIDTYLPWFTKTLPKEYYDELIGISIASGLPVGEVTIFNIFYEFYSACTSIVMQSSDNRIYLGRNLDFGFLLGWDIENKTWMAPEFLRPLVVKLEFKKQNATIYKSVGFAGYVGILTAVKKDSFALSVNERFRFEGGYVGIAEWLIGRHNQKWIGLLTREIMESADSYSQAQKLMYTPTLVAPVYFILAGRKSHQGCVVTRGRSDSDVWSLDNYSNSTDGNGKWFLVQTNYDHWKKPPFYDDRVDPANKCMLHFGADNAQSTLYKVLSTRPILNKLTTFTAIMDITTGDLQTWIRTCEDPCWPW